jgi:hypothetical protein
MFQWSPKLIRNINKGAPRAMTNPSREDLDRLVTADMRAQLARAFFTPLADHVHTAMAPLHDGDLAAAHRVFSALMSAMQTFQDEVGGKASGERRTNAGCSTPGSPPADA